MKNNKYDVIFNGHDNQMNYAHVSKKERIRFGKCSEDEVIHPQLCKGSKDKEIFP